MEKTYPFFTDPGHGWLRVPRRDLVTLGVAHRITPYSYQKDAYVYLEEDCDASRFLQAAEAAGWKVTVQERVQARHPSVIRTYDEYYAEDYSYEYYVGDKNEKKVLVKVEYDTQPIDPITSWEPSAPVIACSHPKYNLGHSDGAERIHSLLSRENGNTGVGNLPALYRAADKAGSMVSYVYLYNHSGLAVSLTPYADKWDSGKVGIMVWTNEQREKYHADDIGDIHTVDDKSIFESYFDEWATFVRGENFTISISDLETGNEIEYLGGIYGTPSINASISDMGFDVALLKPWPFAAR